MLTPIVLRFAVRAMLERLGVSASVKVGYRDADHRVDGKPTYDIQVVVESEASRDAETHE